MVEKRENHHQILTSIMQDHDGDVPKFLDVVLSFLGTKTSFGMYEKSDGEKIVNSSVQRHFDTKREIKGSIKPVFDHDSFDNLVPFQNEQNNIQEDLKNANVVVRKKEERKNFMGFRARWLEFEEGAWCKNLE